MQKIISIKNGVTRMPEWRMADPVNFEACDGEHIAIVGPNGGGKSMFVDIIVGRHPLLMHDPDYDFSPSQKTMVSDNIKYITFRDTYGGDNDRTYFLQQRWNQLEIDENTPIVKDKLEEAYQMAGEDTPVITRNTMISGAKTNSRPKMIQKMIITASAPPPNTEPMKSNGSS